MPIERFGVFEPRIDPTAYVHPGAWILGDVVLGENVSVWPTTVLRGDCGAIRIGARTSLQDGTVAHATINVSETTVGTDCTIGHRVTLHGCSIGNRCLIGMGSLLMDNVIIGDDSFVAAGTLLPPGKVFEPRSFIKGTPGKRVREVSAEDIAEMARAAQNYLALVRRYLGTA